MFNKVDNFEVSGLVVRLNASLLAFWIFWRVGVFIFGQKIDEKYDRKTNFTH